MATINANFLKLKAGYLFPEIARRVKAFSEANPEAAAEIIRCGIGDVTEALPQAVQFLTKQGVDFRTYLKDEKDGAFIDAMSPEWGGALPASFLYDSEGQLRQTWEGKVTYDTLHASVTELLEET